MTSERSPGGISWHTVLMIWGAIDTMNRAMLDQVERDHGVKPACRKGCSACCTYPVAIYAPESEVIARYVNQHGQKQQIVDRLFEWNSQFSRWAREHGEPAGEAQVRLEQHVLNGWGIERIACPLLDTKSRTCMMYQVRPGICRTHNAIDPPVDQPSHLPCGCVISKPPEACFTGKDAISHNHVSGVYNIGGAGAMQDILEPIRELWAQQFNGVPEGELLPVGVLGVGITRYKWKRSKRVHLKVLESSFPEKR